MDEPLGGTELQKNWLIDQLPNELTAKVQLICRPSDLDEEKKKILWVHDMPADVPFLADANARKLFTKIVFVSSWQQTVFNINAGVPFSEGVVIKNAIYPIKPRKKSKDEIRLIYHPTPHRGLKLLVPVFERLSEKYDNIHLDVFSNFDLYARPEANKQFESLYQRCKDHPKITYHGTQPNEVVRDYLSKAHIFAYPSIWRETSCASAMEAMSARCLIVAPNYGALPETLANFNVSYNWTEDLSAHEKLFESKLETAVRMINSDDTNERLDAQKVYADRFYNNDYRVSQWIDFLSAVVEEKEETSSRKKGLVWT